MKIEKNVPIPKITRVFKRKAKSKYPFARMTVGDSVGFRRSFKVKVHAALSAYKEKHSSTKFITRLTQDEFRVWRTA